MERSAALEAQFVETLSVSTTIKRFGIEQFTNFKTEAYFVKLLKSIFKASNTGIVLGTVMDFVSSGFTILLLWVGTDFVIDRTISPGELLSFYTLIGYFTGPAMGLIGSNKTIQDALIAADRLFEIMDLERENTENKVPLTKEMLGTIAFRDVQFRYGTRVSVFNHLSLSIPNGKITAIVGQSGSGKSTLMSLLQNLYPLNGGSIYIGQYDIKHIDNDSLRKLVAVVPQNTDLFNASVLENVALGEFEPDMQRVLDVCSLIGINEFIEKLPQGYTTNIGENGSQLSGGQRQRLAIARALYRNPEILILDEATSSLDSISEKYIQNAISALRLRGKTIIIIAHRLSTIKYADKILVLENGTLVQEGTHAALVATDGIYQNLWLEQYSVVN